MWGSLTLTQLELLSVLRSHVQVAKSSRRYGKDFQSLQAPRLIVIAKGARARADNCEAACQTAEEKALAEAPPLSNIDCASEILPSLSNDVGQEAKQI